MSHDFDFKIVFDELDRLKIEVFNDISNDSANENILEVGEIQDVFDINNIAEVQEKTIFTTT